jgi:hypothetical protein
MLSKPNAISALSPLFEGSFMDVIIAPQEIS